MMMLSCFSMHWRWLNGRYGGFREATSGARRPAVAPSAAVTAATRDDSNVVNAARS
jgi:hypothetical protein